MNFDYSLAAVVAAGLLCYMIHALLRPERFGAEGACPWIWFHQACQHGRGWRPHDDQNLCRSGTNKTGRDDNELVTGTSEDGRLRQANMITRNAVIGRAG